MPPSASTRSSSASSPMSGASPPRPRPASSSATSPLSFPSSRRVAPSPPRPPPPPPPPPPPAPPPSSSPPTGTVTFLLAEIDGETSPAALHDQLRSLMRAHGGCELQSAGELRQFAFARASDALAAAVSGTEHVSRISYSVSGGQLPI